MDGKVPITVESRRHSSEMDQSHQRETVASRPRRERKLLGIRVGRYRRIQSPTQTFFTPGPRPLPDQSTVQGLVSHHLAGGEGQLVNQAARGQGVSRDNSHPGPGDAVCSPFPGSPHPPLVSNDFGQSLQGSHIRCQTYVHLLRGAIVSVLGFGPILPPLQPQCRGNSSSTAEVPLHPQLKGPPPQILCFIPTCILLPM